MKISWKRILIAAVWSELLLLAIYLPTTKYAGSAATAIAAEAVEMFVPLFLGGLWVARKIESRFILHGVLVGILANVLYIALNIALAVVLPLFRGQSQAPQSTGVAAGAFVRFVFVLVVFAGLKIFGAAAGAYVGGRRKAVPLSSQAAIR